MDPGDILPIEQISQFFALPPWIVFIGIFFLGYILFKIILKKKIIERNKVDTIDKIILITAIGSIWFFRLILLTAWIWNSFYQYHIIPTLIMISLGLFSIFVIVQDLILLQQPKTKIIEKIKKQKYLFSIGYLYYSIFLYSILTEITSYSSIDEKSLLIMITFLIMCFFPINTLLMRGYVKIL